MARTPVTLPGMQRVVVAVDPSGARGMDDEAADSIGIVVAALGADGRGYVLADRSCTLPKSVESGNLSSDKAVILWMSG
jgi:phage terminase large subunit-like protein